MAAVSPATTRPDPIPASAAASAIPPSAARAGGAACAGQSQQHQPLFPTAENAAFQPDTARAA
eukprot:9196754-Pyramimonas_sp.AAC.1